MRRLSLIFCLIGLHLFPHFAYSQTIKLGMSAPFSGPTKALGDEIRHGAELYFSRYNQSVAGKKNPITLVTLDDGYEPSRTIVNTRKLLNDEELFALFSYVGTPTSEAILPLIQRHKVPFMTPYTGAEFLRSPVISNIINLRSSYYEEAELQVQHFLKTQKIQRVALFIQADAFGIQASQGYINALKANNVHQIAEARYRRNTDDIAKALEDITASKPDVVFCVGTYQPIAKLVNTLRQNEITAPVAMLSFAAPETLAKHLESFDDVYITTVMPDPLRSPLTIVKQYREDASKSHVSHESLEGYLNAALFTAILANTPQPITQEKFLNVARTRRFNLGDLTIDYRENARVAPLPPLMNKVTVDGPVEVNSDENK
ncbi:ABC transporter substrate-binding protein [Thalassotalea euphylliae]|uniref:ABC transporter substrate-binding protein n=1 Tax=Thalassotalea euphylliae TaxID=1655234 RepID=UPI00362D1C0F